MSRSRVTFVDVARGIAMISIILGHIRISAINPFVFTYHVPVFLLITGYFIRNRSSVKEFAFKRMKSMMLPYLVTCIVIILLSALLGLRDGTSWEGIKKWAWASVYGAGTTYQKPFYVQMIGPLWFLPATCIAAILFRCILELPEKWHAAVVAVLFAVGYLTTKYLFWFPMSIQAGCCSVLFLYVGWLFRENEEQIMNLSKGFRIFAVLFGILAWGSFIRNFEGFYVVRSFYGRTVPDVFSSICACGIVILISYVIDRKTKVISRLLRFTGRYSLLVLCVHAVEQNLIKWNLLFARFVTLSDDTFKYIMIAFRPAVILLCVWLLLKLRVVRKIFGYEQVSA